MQYRIISYHDISRVYSIRKYINAHIYISYSYFNICDITDSFHTSYMLLRQKMFGHTLFNFCGRYKPVTGIAYVALGVPSPLTRFYHWSCINSKILKVCHGFSHNMVWNLKCGRSLTNLFKSSLHTIHLFSVFYEIIGKPIVHVFNSSL